MKSAGFFVKSFYLCQLYQIHCRAFCTTSVFYPLLQRELNKTPFQGFKYGQIRENGQLNCLERRLTFHIPCDPHNVFMHIIRLQCNKPNVAAYYNTKTVQHKTNVINTKHAITSLAKQILSDIKIRVNKVLFLTTHIKHVKGISCWLSNFHLNQDIARFYQTSKFCQVFLS